MNIVAGLDFSRIRFQQCYFLAVDIDEGADNGPIFEECHIEKVGGIVGMSDLPQFIAVPSNTIGEFVNEASTNADILGLPLPVSIKVLMTVLRKLFVQSGRGRRENAFYKGLDPNHRAYVREVLEAIEQFEFARPYRLRGPKVWIPNRSYTKVANEILRSPQHSNHPMVVRVRQL